MMACLLLVLNSYGREDLLSSLGIDWSIGTELGLLTLRLCGPLKLLLYRQAPVNHILAFVEPLQIQKYTRGHCHGNQRIKRQGGRPQIIIGIQGFN
ncbi:hypothetical protein PILCRDRAFT_823479, partial [Piloderma croceum F 1598]